MFDFLHHGSNSRQKEKERERTKKTLQKLPIKVENNEAGKSLRPSASNRPRLVHVEAMKKKFEALLQQVPLEKICWSLECNSWITETRTFYLFNEVGEYMLLQFAYTNSGWLKASCQISAGYFDCRQANEKLHIWRTCGKLKRPREKKDPNRGLDGHVSETNNYSASKIKMSESKCSIKITNAEIRIVGPELKQGQHDIPGGKLSGQHKRKGFRFLVEGGILGVDLILEAEHDAIQFGEGNIKFGVDQDEGFIHMKFLPCLKVAGSISINDVSRTWMGVGFGVHQIQGVRPNQVADRWTLGLFISDKDHKGKQVILFMLQVLTSSTYGSETVNYGIFYENNKVQALGLKGKIKVEEPLVDPPSDYEVPQRLTFYWNCTKADDSGFTAECSIQPKTLVDRINLLELLPFIMRKVVETFVTKPYIYQWLDRATAQVDGERKLDGWLLTELSLLNSCDD